MYENEDLTEFDAASPLDAMTAAADASKSNAVDADEMLRLLESVDNQQRMLAARAFCELQDQRAIPRLIQLLTDQCPLIRVSAAYALGRNPSADAVEPLIQQLTDWNGYVRKGTIWALGNCRDRRALPHLLNTLKHDIAAVRLWAASSLGQLAYTDYETTIQAIPPLIEALRRDSSAVVRSNCAWSLGQLCRELPSNAIYAGAVDGLIEALVEDDDVGVQDDTRAALLKLGDPRALQMIEELEKEGFI